MVPTDFPESNHVLGKPDDMTADQCEPLSVFVDGRVVVSCWKITKEELEEFNRTGRIYLVIFGQTMPPASLIAKSPFMRPNEETKAES